MSILKIRLKLLQSLSLEMINVLVAILWIKYGLSPGLKYPYN